MNRDGGGGWGGPAADPSGTWTPKRDPRLLRAVGSSKDSTASGAQRRKLRLAESFRVRIPDTSTPSNDSSVPTSPHRNKFPPPPVAPAPSLQQRFIILLDTTKWGAFYVFLDAALSLMFALLYVVSSRYTGHLKTVLADGDEYGQVGGTMPSEVVVLDFCSALLLLTFFIPRLLFCYPTETWLSRMVRPGVVLTIITVIPALWLRGPWRWTHPPPVYDVLPENLEIVDPTWSASVSAHMVLTWPLRFLRLLWSLQRVLALLEARPSYLRSNLARRNARKQQQIEEHDATPRMSLLERIPWPSPVLLKVIGLIVGVVCTLLTCAGFLHIIEYKYAQDRPLKAITFFDAFFFVFLLATTISYDSAIVPDAPFPRITILCIIFVGISFVPYGIAQVVAAARMRSAYDTSVKADPMSHHVIVVGGGALLEPFTLRHFLDEFLAPAHGARVMSTKVVILAAHEPPQRCARVLREPAFRHRVQWIKGSTMSLDALLGRANLHAARACFVLARKFAADSRAADAENVLRAMAIASSSNSRVPIYVQCLLPDNKRHFGYFADVVVCVDELKRAVLARSAACPGFSTLIYLLTTTIILHGARNKKAQAPVSNALDAETMAAGWLADVPPPPTPPISPISAVSVATWDDFTHSASHGIYPVQLHLSILDVSFGRLAQCIFEDLGLLLFAVGMPDSSDDGESAASQCDNDLQIALAPLDYKFIGEEIVFVIATSEEDAARISGYEVHNVRDLAYAMATPVPVPVQQQQPPEAPEGGTPTGHGSGAGVAPSSAGPTAGTTVGMGVSLPTMDFPSFHLKAQGRRPRMVMFNLPVAGANSFNRGGGGGPLPMMRSRTLAVESRVFPSFTRRNSEVAPPPPVGLQRFHTIDVPRSGQGRPSMVRSTAKRIAAKPLALLRKIPWRRSRADQMSESEGVTDDIDNDSLEVDESVHVPSRPLTPFRPASVDEQSPQRSGTASAEIRPTPMQSPVLSPVPPPDRQLSSSWHAPAGGHLQAHSPGLLMRSSLDAGARDPHVLTGEHGLRAEPESLGSPGLGNSQSQSLVGTLSDLGDATTDPSRLQNHIVVCAPAASGTFPTNLDCFLGPLWAQQLGGGLAGGSNGQSGGERNVEVANGVVDAFVEEDTRVPVVLVSEAIPPPGEWDRLHLRFGAENILHYVHGSPLDPRNLYRAGANRASRAIVLADDDAVVGSTANEKTEDSHAIMTVLNLKAVCPANTFIVAELVHNETMRFLTEHDVSTANADSYLDETIRNVFTASMLDSIIAQAYYNPHLVYIIKQLLWTGLDDSIDEPVNVVQEAIPAGFAHQPYRELFMHLVAQRHAIPLALYRTTSRGRPGAGFRRVILVPPPSLTVDYDDRVFLVCRHKRL